MQALFEVAANLQVHQLQVGIDVADPQQNPNPIFQVSRTVISNKCLLVDDHCFLLKCNIHKVCRPDGQLRIPCRRPR